MPLTLASSLLLVLLHVFAGAQETPSSAKRTEPDLHQLMVLEDSRSGDVAAWKQALQSRLDQALPSELAGVTEKRITGAGDPGTVITQVAQ